MKIFSDSIIYINRYCIVILFIGTFFSSIFETIDAQEQTSENIIALFDKYSSPYREVVYCHLNKSTYAKGEMIGFSCYVFDKKLKVPSQITKNLYCIITDQNDKVIKSKLLRVDNGFTNNVFNVDDLFLSGNYKLKAYTNWMKNFDERNIFVESFKVINPELDSINKKVVSDSSIDVQFLPEGGHFVDLVKTNVGVVVKNSEGFGIPNLIGNVYNCSGKFITTFSTNSLGISKFLLFPKIGECYTVRINYLNEQSEYIINEIEAKGISIQVNKNNSKGRLILQFRTNERTLNDIKEQPFKLTIHNGAKLKGVNISFNETNLVKIIDYKDLFSGINIFTLFDSKNRPILERMVFNYLGIKFMNSGKISYTQIKDSTEVQIPILKNFEFFEKKYNISISVLPKETKSYKRHHNITSHTYLQPYVKGFIENANYYFENIDSQKKYELDNLLITQGWSSYNWNDIFKYNVRDNFAFEDGILLKANTNTNSLDDFVLYPLKNNDGEIIKLTNGKSSFVKMNLYPEGDEKLILGALDKKGKLKSPNLYLQFFPSMIPGFNKEYEVIGGSDETIVRVNSSPFTLIDIKRTQQLDDVLVKATPKSSKLKSLLDSPFQRVDVFNDSKRAMNLTFVNYVNSYLLDFQAFERGGFITLFNRVPTSINNSYLSPIVYLDDVLVNLDFLAGFNMNIVDYVSVNRRGLGEGFLGANGVIRIYTNKNLYNSVNKQPFKNFEFPLTFSVAKKFYVPKYEAYNDSFFKEYGVIDWIPNCKIDDNGNLSFTIYNPANNSIKLFIEGINEKGEFISEVKTLTTSN
ncbi:hypothetical protein [Litoribaculum gwangyangense]|uniref:TonB-dependent receptor plug domain-containing protein n=1 Tax=Litoribaculum gwangyangense TaxID=1130722 RepID=A0ABP9C0S2_9FLAO